MLLVACVCQSVQVSSRPSKQTAGPLYRLQFCPLPNIFEVVYYVPCTVGLQCLIVLVVSLSPFAFAFDICQQDFTLADILTQVYRTKAKIIKVKKVRFR